MTSLAELQEKVLRWRLREEHEWELDPELKAFRCKHCGILTKSYYCSDCQIITPHIPIRVEGKAKNRQAWRQQLGKDAGDLVSYRCMVCGNEKSVRVGGRYGKIKYEL
jgi:DNA-directed RNA polymerase subunit RPC12/RpoP